MSALINAFELEPRQGLMICKSMGAISSISNTTLQILILNVTQRHKTAATAREIKTKEH